MPTVTSIQLGNKPTVTLSPRGPRIRYVSPLRDTSAPFASSNGFPAVTAVVRPFTTKRSGRQTAIRDPPRRAAPELFTDALGHVGAPDTCRVCTSMLGVLARTKSPAAWK